MENKQKSYLLEISKWEKFMGILMSVSAVLVAACGIVFIILSPKLVEGSAQYAQIGKTGIMLMGVFYLVLAGICLIPACYLFKSAKALKSGLLLENEADVTVGLKNCKSYFKFTSIYTVIGLSVAIIVLVATFVVVIAAL